MLSLDSIAHSEIVIDVGRDHAYVPNISSTSRVQLVFCSQYGNAVVLAAVASSTRLATRLDSIRYMGIVERTLDYLAQRSLVSRTIDTTLRFLRKSDL